MSHKNLRQPRERERGREERGRRQEKEKYMSIGKKKRYLKSRTQNRK
jgi:hypothetical protein